MDTGIRIDKQSNSDNEFCAVVCHDYINNKFYSFKRDGSATNLTDFIVQSLNVQVKQVIESNSDVSFTSPIQKIRD